ncbi:MAG: hypothetical protein IPI53_13765 [Saprospiraceae bacterium]|nr:hypothetical protein [Saprospiraceae bacterium]
MVLSSILMVHHFFQWVAAGNYFIAIKHRNHCGFMTNGTIVVPNPSLLNLTNNSVTLYAPSHGFAT